MDSSVWPKDEIWFLRVCHHISTGLYHIQEELVTNTTLVTYLKWKCQALTGAFPLWGANEYHEPEAEAAGFSETLIPTELHATSQ